MGSRERLVLILLSLALAGGLFALVIAKGGPQETDPPVGSVGPEGWSLSRIPSAGQPIDERQLESGVVVQTLEEGQGPVLEDGASFDLLYTVFTLDGVQRGRGVFPKVVLGGKSPLPQGVLEGLAGSKLFEKRRLLIPAKQAETRAVRGLPLDRDVVFDIRPVELVIDDLVEGTGETAVLNQRIRVHYEGKFESGVVFETSRRQGGRPAEFPLRVGGLIRGWIQGIPGMKVGGTRRLWIPYHLAYGPGGRGEIPPYANLIFEIELLGVQ